MRQKSQPHRVGPPEPERLPLHSSIHVTACTSALSMPIVVQPLPVLRARPLSPPHGSRTGRAGGRESRVHAFTRDVPTDAPMTHAGPTSAAEATVIERAREAANISAAERRAAAEAQAKIHAAEAAHAAARKRSEARASAAAGGSKRPAKRARAEPASVAPPVVDEEAQFEVEVLLAKRIRLSQRNALRRMRVVDSTGSTAEEIGVAALDDILAAHAALSAVTPAAAAAAKPVNPLPPPLGIYSLVDPSLQLPVVEYMIRWRGYGPSSDSWEPKWNIHHVMIDEFENALAGRRRTLDAMPPGHEREQAAAEIERLVLHPTMADLDPVTRKKAEQRTAAADTLSKTKKKSDTKRK